MPASADPCPACVRALADDQLLCDACMAEVAQAFVDRARALVRAGGPCVHYRHAPATAEDLFCPACVAHALLDQAEAP